MVSLGIPSEFKQFETHRIPAQRELAVKRDTCSASFIEAIEA